MLRRPPSHQYQNEITFITAIITSLHNVTLHYTFTIAILHVIIKYGSCTTDLPQVCSQKSISQSVPEHVLSIFSLAKHGHLVDGSEHGGWLKRLLWPGMALTLTCCTSSTPGVSKTLYWGTSSIWTERGASVLLVLHRGMRAVKVKMVRLLSLGGISCLFIRIPGLAVCGWRGDKANLTPQSASWRKQGIVYLENWL